MSATEELIAAEVGRMSLSEKKESIAESHISTSSSSSSSTNKQQCDCVKNHLFCNQPLPGCHLPPQPCLLPQWGPFYVVPPSYCHYYPHLQRCCASKISCHQVIPPCGCPGKGPAKARKASKIEQPASAKAEENVCNCCKEGKCECCKSGKECGKDDDKESAKSEKSDAGSGNEGGDDEGEEEEEDDEEKKMGIVY